MLARGRPGSGRESDPLHRLHGQGRFTGPAGTDAQNAERLLHRAEAGCLITSSLLADTDLVPEVNRHDNARANIAHFTAFSAGLALMWLIRSMFSHAGT